ncbi:TetR family transcriptional regulator [Paenibacillus terreus]|uniref:TetR family transcriptional regulator n=1 Tax=Paenibacillus terreus TaxID=1387834 RepID=A0ABV5B3H8_9BACL
MEGKQSFIAEARREQIIKAAIEVLGEVGYVHASLSQIAKKAKISTALISYHFTGKEDLMNNTLVYLTELEWSYISDKVGLKPTPSEKLAAFIEVSLDYQAAHRLNNLALIEIVFNARTPDHVPYYKLEDDVEEDLTSNLLQEILLHGQEAKEFGDFNPQVASTVIKGAISESILSSHKKMDSMKYNQELAEMIMKMVRREG